MSYPPDPTGTACARRSVGKGGSGRARKSWPRRPRTLAEAAWLLPRFIAYLDHAGAEVITVEAALAWAQQSPARPGSKVRARRMTLVRGFARHMAGIDPRTQVPPPGLLPYRQRWRPPFIYSDADIGALMAAVPRVVRSPLRAATYQTLIGLLAATGMRVGEARLSDDAAERRVAIHTQRAARRCPSLASKNVTPHTLRHTAAMALLHAGVDTAVIALWLGHAGIRSTQIYLHADMTIKQSG